MTPLLALPSQLVPSSQAKCCARAGVKATLVTPSWAQLQMQLLLHSQDFILPRPRFSVSESDIYLGKLGKVKQPASRTLDSAAREIREAMLLQ
jgi:hypothetical protein